MTSPAITAPLPGSTEKPIHLMGAVELAAGVANGRLSPVAIAEAFLERIEKYDGEIGCWAYLDPAAIRAEAKVLAEEAAAGTLRGPLHGVPVGLKDIFDVKGMPTRANSKTTDDVPATADSAVARRLRAAGALIFGKTTTVEFAGKGDLAATRNPWNLEHTPGGSSTGSGAAVGARMVPLAIGTQTAGSNLRPASYNGVSGYKATFGRIPRTGCIALSWGMDHPGLIAYSIEDCALVLSALAGRDETDHNSLDEPAPPPTVSPVEAPRIGIVRDFFFEKSEPEMVAAIEQLAKDYEANGATVVEVKLPPLFAAHAAAHKVILNPEANIVHTKRYEQRKDDFSAKHLSSFQAFSLVPATYYLQAQRIRRGLRDQLIPLFENVDVLLMPIAPGGAPKGIDTTGDASLLTPWSFVGFPAAAISAGVSDAGMPMGAQLVGAPLEDHKVLSVAAWAERINGLLPPPPNYP